MIGAGLLARNAVAKGLTSKPWVKTSLAPGSRVVTEYFEKSGLDKALDALGFQTVGYGCTTCIGNSGPLPEPVAKAVTSGDLVAAAVLSGNRNFEGRVNPLVKANYLASPPLVVAYAIAGTVDIDLATQPLGKDQQGKDVFLKDIWPTQKEIADTIASSMTPEMFTEQYGKATLGPDEWQKIQSSTGDMFQWDEKSTYVQEPPFFVDMPAEAGADQVDRRRSVPGVCRRFDNHRPHQPGRLDQSQQPGRKISAGSGREAGRLQQYGARRGNDRVMTRGTFANVRLKNLIAPGTEGSVAIHFPSGEQTSIYDAAMKYKEEGTPLVVLAGAEYGTGSSRDWAAKGTYLLGIRAVIATSFERIHRSNLVGMGVLPLQFRDGESRESLDLDGTETFDIRLDDKLKPQQAVEVTAKKPNGEQIHFVATCRIDTPVEVVYYRNGGILHTVLRQLAKG